ncbi:excinuclease ABC subunit UvrB [Patescibacteria group bacterium]|nr:excinuclease ABC subunit UvrB [Patescibacteria group bacterium]
MGFQINSSFLPSGDQPQAIAQLTAGLQSDKTRQTLLGVTGSGKTFTIANVIQNTQLPTLVISHNKTLAGQLYQEFKELFPNNKVSYFVSYYDYYQPEAYIPSSDTYIAKEVDINDLIDKLRLEATSNLFSGPDNIVVASVSCIYNIGDPVEFSGKTVEFKVGDLWPRRLLLEKLVELFYTRSDMEFRRGTFRVRGESIELWPAYQDWVLVLEIENEKITKILERNPMTGKEFVENRFLLFPAKQYVSGGGPDKKQIYDFIRHDCAISVARFKEQGKMLEAYRLEQRVNYDLEMLEEVGYVNGIENYSIYFEQNRHPGEPPFTLVDYFRHLWEDNFLTVIDESHVTVPQIRGMYQGDLARKKTLVDYGFRLPAAYDNRPLKFTEFYDRVGKVIFVSATPDDFEIKESGGEVAQQVIRPTGLVDPPIIVKATIQQIPDLIEEIKKRIEKKERVLVVTLTKRMAEELAEYLANPLNTGVPFKVAYLHADIDTLERSTILDNLRNGNYDVLVGINLLREGLDLPEVSLVAILDAGQQGFLRSKTSLIQIMGRASRHVSGEVILYADEISPAMREAMTEVNRRREIQLKFNLEHGITPQTISKSIRPKIIEAPVETKAEMPLLEIDPLSLTPPQRKAHVSKLRREMRSLAESMNFEEAIKLRDKIKEIESL